MRRIKVDVIFLGTNGWYDTETGNTISILVNSKNYHVILDAGNGIYKADKYIKDEKPVYLFLSHFHLDHIVGLHVLNKFHLPQGLHIYGQKGTRKVLDIIANEPFTLPLKNLPFKAEIHELSEGPYKIPFPLECRFLLHAASCMGFRFELDGKAIAYVPDTGICENAITLAAEVDLLIAECAFKPGERSEEWPHLNPQDAADIALRAKAKRLALAHFDAYRYQSIEERLEAAKSISNFDNVIVALDDMKIEI
jgi:ribonuclease BN (tRNA processing enzyme)